MARAMSVGWRSDPEARRDLLLLLKEGITNIARHAEARVASLQFRIVGGELRAELRDDGCGFDPAALGRAWWHGWSRPREHARARQPARGADGHQFGARCWDVYRSGRAAPRAEAHEHALVARSSLDDHWRGSRAMLRWIQASGRATRDR